MRRAKTKGAATAPSLIPSAEKAGLLDLAFAELDVLLRDRIVFLLHQLLGLGARVLLGDVVVAGVGARHELHLDGGGLGHARSSGLGGRRPRIGRERSPQRRKVNYSRLRARLRFNTG